jgi:carbon-monoxide dehydrogenase catalytic subunit
MKKKPEELSVDKAAQEMLKLAEEEGYDTAWERLDAQGAQCKFGRLGTCCRNCTMGPCRVGPVGEGSKKGVCGADADTVVARNLIRMIAAGAAAHSDHARRPAKLLKEVAEGRNKDYQIRDEEKLKAVAARFGIVIEGESIRDIALLLAEIALNDFGNQDDAPIAFIKAYAPGSRISVWEKAEKALRDQTGKEMGILPRSIDREVVEIMHRTHIGVDNDPLSLLVQGVRTALGDGWGGSLIATELQDILFGTPKLRQIESNLGVLKADEINIVVHGHEAILSEKIVEVSNLPEMMDAAKKKGAAGINVVGMCCTGNEILMRHGIPIAGNALHQELAVISGAVEAMVVDVQCIFPALSSLASCFHTKFISTSDQAGFPGATHIQFEEGRATEIAKEIVTMAISNFANRNKERVYIPDIRETAIVGFSVEQILAALGGSPEPLLDAVKAGKIRGIVGIVGCNNPKVKQDSFHLGLVKELIKNDVLIIGTGCWAIAAAKAGLMNLKAIDLCGPGLAGVCKSLKIPPCLHMGSCVDCSRMLVLAGALAEALGVDISDLPLVGSAPEWMSEKAVSIGTYFMASGMPVHLWPAPPILGGKEVTSILTEGIKDLVGGYFFVEEDPVKTARLMLESIDDKRKALGI